MYSGIFTENACTKTEGDWIDFDYTFLIFRVNNSMLQ
jgi:hypothetical protein